MEDGHGATASGSEVSPTLLEERLHTPVAGRYEVIVAGGGASGLVAAVAAARAGARTLLVEQQGCLGGTATASYVAQYIGFFNQDVQAVWGLPLELTRRIVQAGGSEGFARYILAEASASPIEIRNFPFNPEVVKWVADDWAAETGVEVLLRSSVVGPVMRGRRVEGLVVEDIGGRRAYLAPVVVDATGDAAVAAKAGVEMQADLEGGRGMRQPHSLVFRLSNVDVARFRAIPRERKRAIALEGVRRGELYWESLSFMSTPGGTDAICLMSRIRGLDPLDPVQASEAERAGRRQVRGIVEFLRREVPGFEKALIAGIAARVGVRESRRIRGQYVLTQEDILGQVAFEDSVALGSGPMDIHDPGGTGIQLFMPPAPFEIPMRCLVPRDVEGLLVTGRSISATQEANGGARHMATAMALGQAAGAMAALAARGANSTRSIPAGAVQALLRREGAAYKVGDAVTRSAAAPATA
jgi:ribulose 1,5-bisphosphate synthetase/thiazole synthase